MNYVMSFEGQKIVLNLCALTAGDYSEWTYNSLKPARYEKAYEQHMKSFCSLLLQKFWFSVCHFPPQMML